MRVLYLGMFGPFSSLPFTALLAAGIDVCGVLVPAAKGEAPLKRLWPEPAVSELPLHTPYLAPHLVHTAWAHQIPVWAVGDLKDSQTVATLEALRPSVALAACFPLRIPPPLLALPLHGFLNLHPSLLPHYRGPEPLFWCFQQGESQTGVTVHFMDEGLDTGEIALQVSVSFADGISGEEAEQRCARQGGVLLQTAVHQLQSGSLPRQPQVGSGSYYGRPTAADFCVLPTWSARRAFNFMRGTAHWQRPYLAVVAGERVWLQTAVAYHPDQVLEQSMVKQGGEVWLQLTPGVLQATF